MADGRRRRWVAPRAQSDPDLLVTRRAVRQVGLQVAALSAVMVLAGAAILLGYLWFDAKLARPHDHGNDTLWVAIDPEDLVEAALVVTVAVIVLAGLGAMLFARRAVKPLEESMHRQRNFVQDASHELRTPLAVLDARIQQLQLMAGDDDPLRPVISELRDDSQSMIDIVNDLLTSVSASAADFEPSDLRAVIGQVEPEMTVIARESGVELRVDDSALARGTVLVEVPELPLRRSIMALVDNAISHSGRGTRVTIEAVTSGHWQIVRVIDEGSGITGIEPGRVFERFAHGNPASNQAGPNRVSHGIGLSLVHDVVTRYGGTVEVERTGTDGTVFRMLLPASRNRPGHRLRDDS